MTTRDHNRPMTVAEFETRLEEGPYAWPGGYPLYLLMSDGGVMSFEAAKSEKALIIEAIETNDHTGGWLPVSFEVNWENTDLTCDHSGEVIPSAYGDDA